MDKTKLEKLLAEGRSVRSIAGELECSPTKVWYWMNKFSLSPVKGLRTRNIPKEEVDRISTAVSTSRSYGESLSKLNKSSHGSTYKALKRWVKELDLDISHFLNKSEIHKSRGEKRRLSADVIFCENSTVDRHTLKKRTIRDSVVEYVCQKCGQNDMWNGERIALILDHINGVNNDNRKENLRFVCPNCEATLSTHCKGYKGLVTKAIEKKTINNHRPHLKFRKVTRPSLQILLEEIDKQGYSAVGRKYGVSDVAIRKWIKCYQKYGV